LSSSSEAITVPPHIVLSPNGNIFLFPNEVNEIAGIDLLLWCADVTGIGCADYNPGDVCGFRR